MKPLLLTAILAPVLTLFAVAPPHASAQVSITGGEPRLALDADVAAELDHIEGLSRTATALYVSGVLVNLMGAGAVVGAGAWGVSQICISWSGGCPPTDSTGPVALSIAGMTAFVGGLVMIFVGVGFDVESGHQRRALRERRPELSFSVAPTDGGAAVSLGGSF